MKHLKFTFGLAVLCLFASFSSNAQAFESGNSFISLGYGYAVVNPSSFLDDGDNFNSGNLGPITLQYEYAVGEKFGIGVDLGFSQGNVEYDALVTINDVEQNVDAKYTKTKITANFRGNAHFGESDVVDPYLAFGIGYRGVNRKTEYDSDDIDDFEWDALIPVSFMLRFGTRFVISDNFGAFVEGGIGHGVVQGGVFLKL